MNVKYISVEHMIEFTIEKEIDLSIFPKYVKAHHVRITFGGCDRPDEIYSRIVVSLESDAVNKGKNEQGMKRLEKFLQILKSNFSKLEFEQVKFSNNVPLPKNLTSIIDM